MVDWDRVEQLRKASWAWDEIAEDPKVGFQAAKGSGDPGRALQVLYRRRQGRSDRKEVATPKPSKRLADEMDRKWTLARIGYLLTPLLGVWALVAYLVPSPVGLILPGDPVRRPLPGDRGGGADLRAFAQRPTLEQGVPEHAHRGPRPRARVHRGRRSRRLADLWLPVPAARGRARGSTRSGWAHAGVSAWQENGKPILYFYGATWCPYCSASSWAIYKAMSEFGTVSGNSTGYSSPVDTNPGTPEMVLANAQLTSNNVSFVVTEDTSGVDDTFPATSNCYESAYVAAYSGNSIPFVAVNGQYIHGGTTLIDAANLRAWSDSSTGGAGAGQVANQVRSESGAAWGYISPQTYWIMAYLVRATGAPLGYFAAQYHWSSTTTSGVRADLGQF